jgi:tRNA threonylcarbamoyl adenosine modification protein (Sua5/YciO/YrdC/YwlC family)
MSQIDAAVAALRVGNLVVIPTDTVYGVAGLPRGRGAVASIFDSKGRPEDKPVPVLGATVEDLEEIVRFDDRAYRLAERFWPGPLTLVLPRAPLFSYDVGGQAPDTVGVRIPRHDVALELLARTGPLAVSSANRSGAPPAATVDEARAALGAAVAVYVDGGRCAGDVSSVVSLVEDTQVLREGAVPADQILRS